MVHCCCWVASASAQTDNKRDVASVSRLLAKVYVFFDVGSTRQPGGKKTKRKENWLVPQYFDAHLSRRRGVMAATAAASSDALLHRGAEVDGRKDRFDLQRFLKIQHRFGVGKPLSEIREGRKRSHWIWFAFPQVLGYRTGAMNDTYQIKSPAEAIAYLEHVTLGPRLREISVAALTHLRPELPKELLLGMTVSRRHNVADGSARPVPPRVLATYWETRVAANGKTASVGGTAPSHVVTAATEIHSSRREGPAVCVGDLMGSEIDAVKLHQSATTFLLAALMRTFLMTNPAGDPLLATTTATVSAADANAVTRELPSTRMDTANVLDAYSDVMLFSLLCRACASQTGRFLDLTVFFKMRLGTVAPLEEFFKAKVKEETSDLHARNESAAPSVASWISSLVESPPPSSERSASASNMPPDTTSAPPSGEPRVLGPASTPVNEVQMESSSPGDADNDHGGSTAHGAAHVGGGENVSRRATYACHHLAAVDPTILHKWVSALESRFKNGEHSRRPPPPTRDLGGGGG